MPHIELKVLKGQDILPYVDTVSEMRMRFFREFPYLYEGDVNYEKQYMLSFINNINAILLIATDEHENIVAISTGLPLISLRQIIQDANLVFAENNLSPDEFFYFAETIIVPEYRGKGLYSKIVAAREQIARELGYERACFITVARGKNHPLKPKNYRSPEKIFKHCGYTKTNMAIVLNWPTIQADGTVLDSQNTVVFWIKNLY